MGEEVKLTLSDNGTGIYEGPLTEALLRTVEKLPGRTRWLGRRLWMNCTPATLELFLTALGPGLTVTGSSAPLEALERQRGAQAALAAAKAAPTPSEDGYAWGTVPYEHQRRAWHLSRSATNYALFLQMGTGKSKIVIDNAAWLHEKDQLDVLIIVAPNLVHRKWAIHEVETHLPVRIGAKVGFWQGSRWYHQAVSGDGGLQILTLNVESFSRENSPAEKEVLRLTKGKRWMFVLDESSRAKNIGAKRTRTLIKLGKTATYRRILSGQPVTQGVEDLYSQFLFLSPDILGMSTFTAFKARYCQEVEEKWKIPKKFKDEHGRPLPNAPIPKRIVGYKNMDDLIARIDPYSFRVTKAECLDLPPKTYVRVEVPLTSEQQCWYDKVRDEVLIELESGALVDLTMAIVKLTRLQQIVSGHLKLEDTVTELESDRFRVAADLIEEAAGKVVVWCRYLPDVRQLSAELEKRGIQHGTYTGQTSIEGRAIVLESFMKGFDMKVFLGTASAGGIGLDLTAADTMIYFSHSFSAEERWQSEDRIHRIGQTSEKITIYDLVSPGTTDSKILAALKRKKSVADMVAEGGLKEVLL